MSDATHSTPHFLPAPGGLLVVLSGPSGVGKSSIVDELLKLHPGEYCESVSATTRAPRPGEVHGREYFFLSAEEFDAWVRDGKFLEHAEYQGRRYGTPKPFIEEQLAAGRVILLDIDVQGMQQIDAAADYPLLTVFVLPPKVETLLERLANRGTEDEAAVYGRMERARHELRLAPLFDHQVVNDNLENAVKETDAVIAAARQILTGHGQM